MFGLFKKNETPQEEALVQGKYYCVKEHKPWGLYHVRTEGLTGYNTEISSYALAEPANRLADIYNRVDKTRKNIKD